jgi:ABC-2 type transport system permease protein
MERYWRLIALFWSTSIAAELEYRLNFVIASLTSLGNLLGSIFGLFLFYRNDYNFSGWSWYEATIVLGIFTLLQGFSNTFLAPNLNKIVQQVEQGTLDFVLLKPIDSQFWLSTRSISPWGIPDLFFGVLLIAYAGAQLDLKLEYYLLSFIPLGFGLIVLYSLWFILGATSIWFVKIYNVTEVLRGLLDAGRYPMEAYPAAYRFFFTFIIPVAFLTTVPAETMLARSPNIWILGSGILALILFSIAKYFWQYALRFYTSASS